MKIKKRNQILLQNIENRKKFNSNIIFFNKIKHLYKINLMKKFFKNLGFLVIHKKLILCYKIFELYFKIKKIYHDLRFII